MYFIYSSKTTDPDAGPSEAEKNAVLYRTLSVNSNSFKVPLQKVVQTITLKKIFSPGTYQELWPRKILWTGNFIPGTYLRPGPLGPGMYFEPGSYMDQEL